MGYAESKNDVQIAVHTLKKKLQRKMPLTQIHLILPMKKNFFAQNVTLPGGNGP